MAKKIKLTCAQLKKLLSYNPKDGTFRWLASPKVRMSAGDIAGCAHHTGYRFIKIKQQRHAAHRLAWLYVHGNFPPALDHANGIKNDNRISNLRIATRSQNHANRNGWGVVPYKGVYIKKGIKLKYAATIYLNKKPIYLGYFNSAVLAALAYDKAAKKHFGKFAKFNFPHMQDG